MFKAISTHFFFVIIEYLQYLKTHDTLFFLFMDKYFILHVYSILITPHYVIYQLFRLEENMSGMSAYLQV